MNVSIFDEYHAPRATTTEFAVCVSRTLQMFVLCFHLITSHRHAYTGGAGGVTMVAVIKHTSNTQKTDMRYNLRYPREVL